MTKRELDFTKLNDDIQLFPQVTPITSKMKLSLNGVSKLVMLDRYSFKDTEKRTLTVGDFVVLTIKDDPKFPARGTGFITELDLESRIASVEVEAEYRSALEPEVAETGIIKTSIDTLDKPLEIFYEQIAYRNARNLASVEKSKEKREEWFKKFYDVLVDFDFVPAGRVLYGAGANTQTTFFNCYVMPFIQDSREGISEHRKKVMEIMSRGGGVGTNGSTLRPKNALARGVNGKSSGTVSWLDDIAKLTHLVEQGGSRRGAQMIMLIDNHPDIVEFIISKMQNPRILRFLMENVDDEQIKKLSKEKLKFTPLTETEKAIYTGILNFKDDTEYAKLFSVEAFHQAEEKLRDNGTYSVHNPEFLSGANISVCLTKDFMAAVENDEDYELRYPDIDNYNSEEKAYYNEHWHEVGDVRKWEALGYGVRIHRKIKARELWKLINVCSTYSAEPGIFFIDNANEMTNATTYGQQVVATNPCGEQPLAPYSVCNLAAVNLANMVNKENKSVDFDKLRNVVEVGVHLQDNVINATPYFLEENEKQALGERRVGLGVMGLADLLIYCEKEYGSPEGNEVVNKVFEVIATTAYRSSINIAKEKGSFPFLDVLPNGEPNENGREKFINSGYMKEMPEDIRQGILEYGIRNSHLITVAPTGSTGTMVGVATGLEPYFSFSYFRSGRLGKFIEVNAAIVQEYLNLHPEVDKSNLPNWFISAMRLAPEAHADVQCIIQRWVDSSISKTVNAPAGFAVEQVQTVYERLFKGGAKGGTVYVDGSRDSQVLTLKAESSDVEQIQLELKTDDDKEKEPKVFMLNTIAELSSTSVTFGSEVGETCPVCRNGTVRDMGGCNTCDQCNASLKCGL